MKLGVCVGLDRVRAAAEAGWDYVELGVGALAPDGSDSEWAPVRDAIAGVPVEACNCFLPGAHRITGPDVALAGVLGYVSRAMDRMTEVGARVVVLGSGGARNLPDGWSKERGLEQIAEFLAAAAPIAHAHGVAIAVEPLRPAESNIINLVDEATDLVRRVNHPSVRVLADYYHMAEGGDSLDAIARAGALLAHVHTADVGRKPPGAGERDHHALLAALRAIGYAGRLSVECSWSDFDSENGASLAFLRECVRRSLRRASEGTGDAE